MGLLDIRVFGDPVLRQRSRAVDEFDERLAILARDMLETMRDADGVGLAANQVGVLKRLFTWELHEPGDGEDADATIVGGAVVNPVLDDASEQIQEGDEGCLSFPGLFYPVDRPLTVSITWQDLRGEHHRSTLEGFHARVWLHEMDHLDGVLFIDHLAKHDRKEAMKRMREYRLERGIDEPTKGPAPGSLLLGKRRS